MVYLIRARIRRADIFFWIKPKGIFVRLDIDVNLLVSATAKGVFVSITTEDSSVRLAVFQSHP